MGRLVQRGEPTEDDALVIGPGRLAVILARRGEAVVDEVRRVDEPAGVEPGQLFLSPLQVRRLVGYQVKAGGQLQEEFVGDGVLIVVRGLPYEPAAALGRRPGCGD